jgi:hypothetical protein
MLSRLMYAINGLNVADALITYIGMQFSRLAEGNPMANAIIDSIGWWPMVAVKVGYVLMLTILVNYFAHRKASDEALYFAKVFEYGLAGILLALCLNNIIVTVV